MSAEGSSYGRPRSEQTAPERHSDPVATSHNGSETVGSCATPGKLTFTDPDKIRELARRGEAWATSEARQMLEHAIETGRGGLCLRLTPEQYRRLRR
jgi:hypothetical protein